MKLVDIKIKDEKGNILALKEARLIEGQGIQGDIKARGGDRQVSILSLKARDSLEGLRERGLCIPRFYANIIIDGLEVGEIYVGKKIELDKGVIEISQIGKECFDDCHLSKSGQRCALAGETIFARVLLSGIIKEEV